MRPTAGLRRQREEWFRSPRFRFRRFWISPPFVPRRQPEKGAAVTASCRHPFLPRCSSARYPLNVCGNIAAESSVRSLRRQHLLYTPAWRGWTIVIKGRSRRPSAPPHGKGATELRGRSVVFAGVSRFDPNGLPAHRLARTALIARDMRLKCRRRALEPTPLAAPGPRSRKSARVVQIPTTADFAGFDARADSVDGRTGCGGRESDGPGDFAPVARRLQQRATSCKKPGAAGLEPREGRIFCGAEGFIIDVKAHSIRSRFR
jgi:hypothetical protein